MHEALANTLSTQQRTSVPVAIDTTRVRQSTTLGAVVRWWA